MTFESTKYQFFFSNTSAKIRLLAKPPLFTLIYIIQKVFLSFYDF